MDTKEIEAIRAQFPILKRMVNKMPLVYFDNGATVQKPEQVIRSMSQFYANTESSPRTKRQNSSRGASSWLAPSCDFSTLPQ